MNWLFFHIQWPLAKGIFSAAFWLLTLISGGSTQPHDGLPVRFIEYGPFADDGGKLLAFGYEKESCTPPYTTYSMANAVDTSN